MKTIKDTNKLNLKRQKKLNQLVDEMFAIEVYSLEYGKYHRAFHEKRLCTHKAKFFKIINDLLDECYECL